MRPIWMVAAVVALMAGPAMAQGLIAPSRQYKTPQREKLDKSYGLPTFGTPAESMPKQQTMAPVPKQEPRADPFRPMPNFASPDAPAADSAPDFFQKPAGLASAATSDVPNFFQNPTDLTRPRNSNPSGGETPMFTTDQDASTADTTTNRLRADDGTDVWSPPGRFGSDALAAQGAKRPD